MSTAKFTVRRPAKAALNHQAPRIETDPEELDQAVAVDEVPLDPEPAAKPKKKSAGPLAKLGTLRAWVNSIVVGREAVVDATILAIVARQNCLFLGAPGTAKTYCVHKLASAFANEPGDVFDILLTKFSKPAEILGPISIRGLESDEVRYCTEGFLPTAKLSVLDEIFKGSSAILNALLQLANERKFRNGKNIEESPLRVMIGMSNEFPEDPATLAAFFDRFPVKLMVASLDSGDFGRMLDVAASGSGKSACPVTLTGPDLDSIDAAVAAVALTGDVLGAVSEIRQVLHEKGVQISDRRWVQALGLIRASAYLAGRTEATRTDLKVLELVCWNAAAEVAVIKQVVPDYLNPFEAQLRATIDDVYNERERIYAAGNLDGADKSRNNPDMPGMCGAAAGAIVRIKNTAERVKIIADDMAQTDEDKALAAQAQESIAVVLGVIQKIVTGKAGVEELKATEAKDTH